MDSIVVDGDRFGLARALEADVPALVALLADDPLGAGRESTTIAPYLEAFRDIDGDDHQLLLVVRNETGDIVGTMQLTAHSRARARWSQPAPDRGCPTRSPHARRRPGIGAVRVGSRVRQARAAPAWCS